MDSENPSTFLWSRPALIFKTKSGSHCEAFLTAKPAHTSGKPQRSDGLMQSGQSQNANGMNKISILVPCHRVIGTDYGGGLWRKQWLLEMESANN